MIDKLQPMWYHNNPVVKEKRQRMKHRLTTTEIVVNVGFVASEKHHLT